VRKLTVNRLADALSNVVNDEGMRMKAGVLGEQIRKENGVKNAINFIYRDLEFARERIMELRKRNAERDERSVTVGRLLSPGALVRSILV
jgi:sterol 3beta-glucosyltransferase